MNPIWIGIGISGAALVLSVIIASLKLSERIFATKEEVAKIQKESADKDVQLQQALSDKMSVVKSEAADKLAKAVEDRRKDVAAMEAMLRADHKEKMEAIEDRLLQAIKESKEDRKAGETALFAKIDHLANMVLKPRTGETHAIPRESVR